MASVMLSSELDAKGQTRSPGLPYQFLSLCCFPFPLLLYFQPDLLPSPQGMHSLSLHYNLDGDIKEI